MIKIAPSILSADFANLERDIRRVSSADWLHVDVMDGCFVPNLTIGVPVVQSIRKCTGMFLDVHLMIDKPVRYVEAFAPTMASAKAAIHCCPVCQNFSEGDGLCPVCQDPKRDTSVICVVADPKDVVAMERSREYPGLYHVLHGVISPMNHVGPDDIRVKELVDRVAKGDVREVIMATNPDTEGEATAMYLSRLLKPFQVRVTRLAYGIPVGSHLEYADDATLMRALEGRREM